jgi:origin recognition complex subunit 1
LNSYAGSLPNYDQGFVQSKKSPIRKRNDLTSCPYVVQTSDRVITDSFKNELYISPSWDLNVLESINGKAIIMSEKAFNQKYPSGRIPRKSNEYGKTFICRRGCDTKTTTYTEEFIWEDVYHGTEEDVECLIERLKRDTRAVKRRNSEKRKVGDEEDYDGDHVDEKVQTPRKKQKTSAASTPRKPRTPSKLITPSHKRYPEIYPSFVLHVLILV